MTDIEPERRFAFTWHPYPVERDVDYSAEEPTLVEFGAPSRPPAGARVTVTESGFDRLPGHRRAEAFRMNDGGWKAYSWRTSAPHVGGHEAAVAAPVIAALGDPTRLGLVAILADGRPRSVSELSEGRPISRQAVTKHLHVLEAAGVVGSLRRPAATPASRSVPDRIASARDYLDDVGRQWEAALGTAQGLRRGSAALEVAHSARSTASGPASASGRASPEARRPTFSSFLPRVGPGSRPAKPRPKAVQP